MIELEFLAKRINELIGTDKFCVYLNTDVFNEDIGDRNAVIMSVSRVPFGYTTEELDAESMIVTLVFDLPVSTDGEDLTTRDIALSIISDTLLGHQKFKIATPDGSYWANCFFQQQAPTEPFTDDGRITQQITISGTVLIQSTSCQALVGNDIHVFIDDVELLKTSHSSALQYGTDSNLPLSQNETQPQLEVISSACTKTLNLIYTGKEIETNFLKMAEGSSEEDINTIHRYKVNYGDFLTIEVPIKILSVSIASEVGVYLKYALAIQTVKE